MAHRARMGKMQPGRVVQRSLAQNDNNVYAYFTTLVVVVVPSL